MACADICHFRNPGTEEMRRGSSLVRVAFQIEGFDSSPSLMKKGAAQSGRHPLRPPPSVKNRRLPGLWS